VCKEENDLKKLFNEEAAQDMDKVVVLLLLAAQISKGCFPEPRQSRSFKSNNHGKYITLNEGQLWASKPNLSIGKGQSLFGRSSIIL